MSLPSSVSGPIRVGVVGTTTWGTTLAVRLAAQGLDCRLWCRSGEEAERLASARRNTRRLPAIAFPPSLQVSASEIEVARPADLLILAVPSQSLRENARRFASAIGPQTVVLSAAKGLEIGTGRRMSEILEDELRADARPRIAVLSGPNLAGEIARGLPASAVVAARRGDVAGQAQAILTSPTFRIYTQSDVIGVELGGALKNIIALGAGIADGLESGDKSKAALITRGLAEMTRLGVAAGAEARTFAGLAGLGDLVATCSSRLSRNHTVGERLGRGEPLDAIIAGLGQVAEGVPTTRAARGLARELGVEMPIADQLWQVLFAGKPPRQAVTDLMTRAPTTEVRS